MSDAVEITFIVTVGVCAVAFMIGLIWLMTKGVK